jgi:hypothetical protein
LFIISCIGNAKEQQSVPKNGKNRAKTQHTLDSYVSSQASSEMPFEDLTIPTLTTMRSEIVPRVDSAPVTNTDVRLPEVQGDNPETESEMTFDAVSFLPVDDIPAKIEKNRLEALKRRSQQVLASQICNVTALPQTMRGQPVINHELSQSNRTRVTSEIDIQDKIEMNRKEALKRLAVTRERENIEKFNQALPAINSNHSSPLKQRNFTFSTAAGSKLTISTNSTKSSSYF